MHTRRPSISRTPEERFTHRLLYATYRWNCDRCHHQPPWKWCVLCHRAARAWENEPPFWQADIQRAASELGWGPKYTLEQGLTKTIDWFKEHMNLYP